jgi:hypothetical protein
MDGFESWHEAYERSHAAALVGDNVGERHGVDLNSTEMCKVPSSELKIGGDDPSWAAVQQKAQNGAADEHLWIPTYQRKSRPAFRFGPSQLAIKFEYPAAFPELDSEIDRECFNNLRDEWVAGSWV